MSLDEYDIQEQSSDQSTSQIDFQKFLRGIWKRKFLILILMIVTAIPFYLKAKNAKPVYETQVTIQVKQYDSEENQILNSVRRAEIESRSFKELVASQLGMAFTHIDTNYAGLDEIFEERQTTHSPVPGHYKVGVDDMGMYHLYQVLKYANPETGSEEENRHLLSGDVWEAVQSFQTVNGFSFKLDPDFVHLENTAYFRVRTFDWAVKFIENRVQPLISKTGNFMVLKMTGPNPNTLPEQLNKVAEAYVQQTLELHSLDENNYETILRQQLKVAEQKLENSLQALREFSSQYPLSLNAEKEKLLAQIKENDAELKRLPKQRQNLTKLLDKLENPDNNVDEERYRRLLVHEISGFEAILGEPEMVILRGTLQSLEKQYDELVDTYGAQNPDAQRLKREIDSTQQKVIDFAREYRNFMVSREAELQKRAKELQIKTHELPNDEYRLLELERQKKLVESQYETILEKVQRLEISEANNQKPMWILDRAIRPRSPINPSMTLQSFTGAFLGLIIGLVLSIGIDLIDPTLRSVREVDKHLSMQVIGTIPDVAFEDIPDYLDAEKAKQIDRQLVTHDYSPTPIGEAYRALRTHLLYSRELESLKSLLITSVSQEEGKSFTASNLAIIMAQQKTNTLLVDADLRRGVLHNTFGVEKTPGLTNYLANNATLAELVQSTHIPNLSVISCGSMIPNPSEQLGSLQMKRFIDEASRKFDFILFDAPPMDAATDSVVLGTLVHAVAVVVRAGKTKRKSAKERLEIFNSVHARMAGVIINGTEEALLKNSYSYYHY